MSKNKTVRFHLISKSAKPADDQVSRDEVLALREKVADLIAAKPDKAAIIFSSWLAESLSQSPATAAVKKSTSKKSA